MNLKAQSAMEFLMTYGWAILVIAVVLGALYSLGIFQGGGNTGTNCLARAGFLCQNPALGSNGNLTITLSQATGGAIYNVGVGCAATSAGSGLPNPSAAMVYLTQTGAATVNAANGPQVGYLNLLNGQGITVTGLKCFNNQGNPLVGVSFGTSLSGTIWVNYTLQNTAPGGGNPMLTVKVATLNARVV